MPELIAEARIALVLAGGGTKGAFEAGAVTYVVEELGLVPDIVTATSAGAIIAVVLAQARTHAEWVERCRDLRHDLLSMTDRDRVFGRQPWMAALAPTPVGEAVDHLIGARPPLPGNEQTAPPDGSPRTRAPGTRMAQQLRWTRRVLRVAARTLPAIVKGRRSMRTGLSSMLTLEPLGQALRHGSPGGIRRIDLELVSCPGLELRLAVTELGRGLLRYVRQDGTLVERDAVTPVAGVGPVDVIEGALISASVPMLFPPRRIGDSAYTDGGVLQNIPLQPAIDLGATRVVTIVAVPLDPPPDPRDFTSTNAMGVLLRTNGAISFADRQRTDLAIHVPDGVRVDVVDPVVDFVGPFEVSPGLMRIDMDYGWLRAADLLDPSLDDVRREQAQAVTEELVVARVHAWYLEESMWTDPAASHRCVRELRDLKDSVRDALERRRALGAAVPEGAEQWHAAPEHHETPAAADPVGMDDELETMEGEGQ